MINTVINPDKGQREQLCRRPSIDTDVISDSVREILKEVRLQGDNALKRLTKLYTGTDLNSLKVTDEEINSAGDLLSEDLKSAIRLAAGNIERFHGSQLYTEAATETMPGVLCWRKSVGIEKVGLYIPGGNAPLFSTVLMLGIPANIAGCKEIILCTPADKNGKINPAILFTAGLVGIRSVFMIGGAQAIAAMAYGTETVPKVDKIFGPGNQYVTRAKELIQTEGIAIDMPAGPSEVLVVADEDANPSFVAADLISQAEHGPDSQATLVTNSKTLLEGVLKCLSEQINELPQTTTTSISLDKSNLILMQSIEECFSFSNLYAPEHLIIATRNARADAEKVANAGSVFIGQYSCESAGDYASGTNHTLPTNGYARSYSGLSVDSFIKKITFQQITADGLKELGKAIETMAEAETLYGHKNAVSVRLKTI
ncbi:MAG TPA: histidinol dehydrogenase [Bacteroidales bacterium]|nr:histidinol dehydrogenase [Bacteroidales bacterium]HPT22522.1 histidinol dehydrogenase [Bacteroidales bacterium]